MAECPVRQFVDEAVDTTAPFDVLGELLDAAGPPYSRLYWISARCAFVQYGRAGVLNLNFVFFSGGRKWWRPVDGISYP